MLPTERGRELDAAVAREVMRWNCAKWEAYHYHLSPQFARDIEAEIERRGLRDEYLNALSAILGAGDLIVAEDYYEAFWRIIRSTPEQRCIAALAAVRGAK